MNRIMITEQQIKLLGDAYEQTLGTKDYLKYKCEHYFKREDGNWQFVVWGSPACYKAEYVYLKTVRGETYIYRTDNSSRIKLNDACKELLGIA